jgi:hypothetical protein
MRNEERLGTSQQETNRSTNSTTPPQQIQNLLNFPTSTEFVDLPSRGEFYAEDHPLHGQKQLEMKVMTTKEEDILLNANYIRNGVVIDKLLRSLMVDKSIKLDDLLIGDKNALVFAARASGLGHLYTAKVKCSKCDESTEVEHDLSDLATKDANTVDWISPTESGTFVVDLPKSKLKVEFKLLTGREEKDIDITVAKRKKHRLPVNHLLIRLQKIILSINGVSDSFQISSCLEAMPIMDSRRIRLAYDHVLPDIDTSFDFMCPFCDTEQEVGLPLTADFFWADS